MSSEATESQLQLVPAYGSSSDNKSTADSFRMPTYEDLVRNSDLFWDNLRDLLGHLDKTLKIPVVAGHNLDLHRLFIEVTTRGGVEQVIKNRKCKAVIQSLNVSTTTTNAAYLLKKYYLDILFAFEHVYFFQEPLSSFRSREEAMNRFLIEKKSANHDNDNDNGTHELEAGCLINGIIDGKFEDGYFVTMKMGSQELKGVLYHTPETSADARRRKKKAKSPSEMDFARPKSHRSGYNFFVADQYQRIKHEYAGQDRYPIKEIGNKWSNLPASDRKVYLDKGSEDAERYKTEMSEYYALVQSCAADIVAKIDDAASANDDAAAANDDAAAAHDDAASANDDAAAANDDAAAANDEAGL